VEASVDGWRQLAAEKILSTVARRDDLLIWGTDADEVWVGFDAFSEAVEEQIEAFDNPSYEWGSGDPKIWMLRDAALMCGELHVSIDSAGQRWHSTMRSTFVLQHETDGWVIIHSHYSVGQSERVVEY
jgi:ketosteroid isomerase-like protein